jgi:hypothetical protein
MNIRIFGEITMTILTIAAVLFIITAILHLVAPMLFRNNAATRPIAAYGVIYLILGILILLGTFSWTPIIAIILTLVGGAGVTAGINANPELRSLKLLLIAIDVVIIGLLLINLFAG